MPNQHTPGDWTTKPENEYLPAQVWADGRLLADVFGESREARAANARVMAAAPKMLEACKMTLAYLKRVGLPSGIEAEQYLHAVIARIETDAPCDK